MYFLCLLLISCFLKPICYCQWTIIHADIVIIRHKMKCGLLGVYDKLQKQLSYNLFQVQRISVWALETYDFCYVFATKLDDFNSLSKSQGLKLVCSICLCF